MELVKPKRSFSRAVTIGTLVPAWIAIAWSIWLGPTMAGLIATPMLVLIASVVGCYQGIGHFDLRSQLTAGARPPRTPRPRSSPAPSA